MSKTLAQELETRIYDAGYEVTYNELFPESASANSRARTKGVLYALKEFAGNCKILSSEELTRIEMKAYTCAKLDYERYLDVVENNRRLGL